MDYRVVDMEAYPRKEHFAYFRSLAFPYVGVTRNIHQMEIWLQEGSHRLTLMDKGGNLLQQNFQVVGKD